MGGTLKGDVQHTCFIKSLAGHRELPMVSSLGHSLAPSCYAILSLLSPAFFCLRAPLSFPLSCLWNVKILFLYFYYAEQFCILYLFSNVLYPSLSLFLIKRHFTPWEILPPVSLSFYIDTTSLNPYNNTLRSMLPLFYVHENKG